MTGTPTDGDYLEVMRSILVSESCRGCNPHEPAQITNGVYLGSQRNAECWKVLERLNISHVLNCAAYKGPRSYSGTPYEGLGIDYCEFRADDTDNYDITQHFHEAFRFVDKARQKGGNVLVHCALGINRSGAICLGYLMHRGKVPLLRATRMLKSKRRVVLANTGFQKQLIRYARNRGLLDKLDDEIFVKYNLPRRAKVKNLRERSRSCSSGTVGLRVPEKEVIWPSEVTSDRIANLNGTLDKLCISNGALHHLGGDVSRVAVGPGPRYFGSSMPRFDLYSYSFY